MMTIQTNFAVSTEADLNNAIQAIDASGADAATNTACKIDITGPISLTSGLQGINLDSGSSLTIAGTNGSGGATVQTIDGGGTEVDYALSMFDLGRTFLAAVERSPDATAITDGERRLSYASWYEEIARVAGGLTELGLRHGDRLAVILQNRLEMASLHWACQFAGIVVTPLNWRIKPEELDYCLADADAAATSTMSRRTPSPRRRPPSGCRGSQSARLTGPLAVSKTCKAARTGSRRGPSPRTCRCCFTPRVRPGGRRACRAGTASSAPPRSPMSRRTCTPAASARSASCPSTTRWGCARCWR